MTTTTQNGIGTLRTCRDVRPKKLVGSLMTVPPLAMNRSSVNRTDDTFNAVTKELICR